MKKKIIKLLLITTLSTLILTGCKDSEETISNSVESTETTSVIESSEVAENTTDATSETTATSETAETESNSASAIETSESETDSTTETTTETVSTYTTESIEENTAEENSSDDSTEVATTQGTATLLSSDFIVLLNAKRTEAGLSQVSLDSNLDATALAGVQELPTNYSHNVAGGGYDRCNIGKQYGMASANILFESWWNSEGHRNQMMDPYLTHIAVAYYSDGGYGIFIGNIDDDAYARDLANQLNQNSTATPTEPVNSTDVGNGQTVDTSVTPNAGGVVTEDNWDDLGFESDPNSWDW